MEEWNEILIRQQIDEVITESYLRCLSEREIRGYLRGFLDSCDGIIRNKEVKGTVGSDLTGIKAALVKGYFLLDEDSRPVRNSAHIQRIERAGRKSEHELLAEQVVEVRSSILRLFKQYNPKYSNMLMKKNRRFSLRRRRPLRETSLRPAFLYTGFFALFAVAALLVWLIFLR